jgi:hypothetical protein
MLQGRRMKAGKTEFLVVDTELRKCVLPGSNKPLPWLLFNGLREEAKKYGYQILLNVPSLAASIFHRASQDVLVRPLLSRFKVPRDRSTALGRIGRLANRALGFRDLLAVRGRLAAFARRVPVDAVEEINKVVGDIGGHGGSALIFPSAEMLNMRFPPEAYIKYRVKVPDAEPALLVFSRPMRGGSARLVHWTDLPGSFDVFSAVLVSVIDHVRRDGAADLVIEVPADRIPECYKLEECGFERLKSQYDFHCYLTDTSGELGLNEVHDWCVTHGHKDFYRWRGERMVAKRVGRSRGL